MTEGLPQMKNEEEMGPQHVAAAPVFLASDEATDVTGCTIGTGGGQISFVTDPERDRSLSKDIDEGGAWTAREIRDRWDELTEDYETTRMTAGW